MDNVVEGEISRINAIGVESEHELVVTKDVIDWMRNTPIDLSSMDMKDIIKLFWNERLN